jgi:hypothetical protein
MPFSLSTPGSLPRLARRLGLALAVLVAGAWLFGLVRFVLASGEFEARLPRRMAPPPGEHNLAAQQYGPLVRASSFNRNPIGYHHPWFLVDGRDHPQLLEKWGTAANDRAPWVEVRWREPRTLDRVVIRHAGDVEGDHVTVRAYTLTCLRAPDGAPGPALQVHDNRAKVATHPLACPDAIGVRFATRLPASMDILRLYELEAWGQ